MGTGQQGTRLNGTIGELQSFDVERSRWIVHCDDGEDKAIMPEKLVPIGVALQPGSMVYIKGLQNAPHLNGEVAICQPASGAGRLAVRLASGEEKALKLECVVPLCAALNQGTQVRLKSMEQKPHLNGTMGTCQSMDWGSGDWTVSLGGDMEERVKPTNMIPRCLNA